MDHTLPSGPLLAEGTGLAPLTQGRGTDAEGHRLDRAQGRSAVNQQVGQEVESRQVFTSSPGLPPLLSQWSRRVPRLWWGSSAG